MYGAKNLQLGNLYEPQKFNFQHNKSHTKIFITPIHTSSSKIFKTIIQFAFTHYTLYYYKLKISFDKIPIDLLIQNNYFYDHFDSQNYTTFKYTNLFKITIKSSRKL